MRCASAVLASALPLRPPGFPLRPLGCSRHRRPRSLSRTVHPPVSFDLLQSLTEPACRRTFRCAGSFLEVPCLIAPSAIAGRLRAGYQPVAALRPQVFSTSRRFTPCVALRACFIPLARPGLPLQGFPLSRSRIASRRPDTLLPLPATLLPCGRKMIGPASGLCSP
jgi:hypothetical protein